MTITVLEPGSQTLIQDLGRPGYASMGVSRSGAFDRASLQRGNRILGNRPQAAGLEVLAGGLRLGADADQVICVTGAVGPLSVDGKPVHHEWPTILHSGQTLSLGMAVLGMRTYVTAQGGFDVTPVLGSHATDTLSGIGPPPLAAGDRLAVGYVEGKPVGGEPVWGEPESRLGTGDLELGVTVGPHTDRFAPVALDALLQSRWMVSTESNRIGVRLDGPLLERSRTEELPSAPCLRGSLQVAANGQPIAFGPDHPVTGGYPVIAVINDADTDLLGQARPGQGIRFRRN